MIDGFDSSGVSVRYQGSTVRGNLISNGEDRRQLLPGGEHAARDDHDRLQPHLQRERRRGIFLDDSSVSGFVIANNTIAMTNGNGLNLHRVKALTLVNNSSRDLRPVRGDPAQAGGRTWSGTTCGFNGGVLADAKGGVGNLSADEARHAARPPEGLAGDRRGRLTRLARLQEGPATAPPSTTAARAPDIGAVERRS